MSQLYSFILMAAFSVAPSSRGTVSVDYAAFREKYRPTEVPDQDVVPLMTRQELFEARKAAVEAHNAQPGTSWVAAVNYLADFTEAELASIRGYQRSGGRWSRPGPMEPRQSSFLEAQPHRAIAESVDWRHKLPRSTSEDFKRSQGGCGSCWAVAAVGVMEMHAELSGSSTEPLSFEQLVDCVPNPKHCGGEGGCRGATAELGFQYVVEHGLARAGDYKGYASNGDGTCRPPSSPAATITSYRTLPVNKLDDLIQALNKVGPVVSSVDASGWHSYDSGIFDKCSMDATVNHAVVMVGYGTDDKLGKYYLIRNSWGRHWGEDGYLRLRRHDKDDGHEGFCGVDKDPQAGVGCDGGPAEIPVCGMCGVLSDSAYPEGVTITLNTTL